MQSSLMEQFRTAYEIGKSGQGKELADNYLVDLVKAFQVDPRFAHFQEDIRVALGEMGSTLTDAAKLRTGAAELDTLIGVISKTRTALTDRVDLIIKEKVQEGIEQEGLFEIYPVTRNQSRKVDVDLIKRDYLTNWKKLVKNHLNYEKENYVPSQADLKPVFGKAWPMFLTPACKVIVGHDFRLIGSGDEPDE